MGAFAEAPAAASGGDFVKIAQTVLGSAGASLKIAGQSIDLDPTNTPTYTQLYVVGNLLWDNGSNITCTATINDQTEFTGGVLKNAGGTGTFSRYNNTATIPISNALGRNMSPSFFMWIGVGYRANTEKSLMFNWFYTGNDDTQVSGGGRMEVTASSTFTDIDLIFDSDIDTDSTITLYGIKA